MTFKDAKSVLERISYKPGWKLEINPSDFGAFKISILFLAPDSTAPNRQIEIRFERLFELFCMDEKGFVMFVEYCILDAEHHEQKEWLRVDGRHLTDPHPPQPNYK